MDKKHCCKTCNYSTDRLYDYKKHIGSKLHNRKINNFKQNLAQSVVNDERKRHTNEYKGSKEKVSCEHCGKILSRKFSLKRHYKSCFLKKKVDEKANLLVKNEQNNVVAELIQLLQKKDEHTANERDLAAKERDKKDVLLAKAYGKINKMNKKLLEEQKEIKKLLNRAIGINDNFPHSKMIENRPITAKHVRDNFSDAYHYDKVMARPLNEEEEKMLRTYGPIKGCTKLIQQRCIDGVRPDKRCLHCIDSSRSKFIINVNGKWVTDTDGDKILSPLINKIESVFNKMTDKMIARINKKIKSRYIKEYKKDREKETNAEIKENSNDLHYDALLNHEIQAQLGTIRDGKNWKCILKKISRTTLLSNVRFKDNQYSSIGEDTKQITS